MSSPEETITQVALAGFRQRREVEDRLDALRSRVEALADEWEQFCIDRCTQRDRMPYPGHDCGMTRLGAAETLRELLA